MLINKRNDYTQRLFNQLMANCDSPFIYNCNDLIILSSDSRLLSQLQQVDEKQCHGTLNILVNSELNVTKLSILDSSIRYAILFSSEECWNNNFTNYNNSTTCILFNNPQKLARLSHLTPTIIYNHINNNNINMSQSRVPYLQVKASINNNPISLPNNGLYTQGIDFVNLSNRINNCITTRCNIK